MVTKKGQPRTECDGGGSLMAYAPLGEVGITRVSDQNGVSLLYIMLEIHHSGQEPSISK